MAKETWNYLHSAGGADNKVNLDRLGFGKDSPHGDWFEKEYLIKHHLLVEAFVGWENPATRDPIKRGRLKNAEAAFKQVYRQLYAMLKSSPLATDDDLVAMNMPARSTNARTSAPVPTTYPVCEVDASTLRRLTLHFRDAGSEHKAKPAGAHGCEICWALLDHEPVVETELKHSAFDTQTPITLEFTEAERGKSIYFAPRWQNRRGKKGPFGAIQRAMVP